MNWYEKTNYKRQVVLCQRLNKTALEERWWENGKYHFDITMIFEIENFPDLVIYPSTKKDSGKVAFRIACANGIIYDFYIRIQGAVITTAIIDSTSMRHIDDNVYDAQETIPLQIIREGLSKIDNDTLGAHKL